MSIVVNGRFKVRDVGDTDGYIGGVSVAARYLSGPPDFCTGAKKSSAC